MDRHPAAVLAVLAAPLAVFAVMGGGFALARPHAIESAVGSVQAMAISAAVLVGVVAVTTVTWRLSRRAWAGALAGMLPVSAFLTFTIAPAFDDDTVEEDLAGLTRSVAAPPSADTATPTASTSTPATTTSPPAPATPPPPTVVPAVTSWAWTTARRAPRCWCACPTVGSWSAWRTSTSNPA